MKAKTFGAKKKKKKKNTLKLAKKIVKDFLHSSKAVQNFFQFHEFFEVKKKSNFYPKLVGTPIVK